MSVSSMTVGGKIKYKIVMLGDQHVGKSSVIDRFINDKFEETYNATIGIDFLVRNIIHENKTYRLQLWDTAGQERFKALIPSYLKDSHCAIMMFDLSDSKTLDHVSSWIDFYNDHKEPYSIAILAGNKLDLKNSKQSISTATLESKAKQLNIPFFQVSAKTGQGIQEMFKKIVGILSQSINKYHQEMQKIDNNEGQGTSSVIVPPRNIEPIKLEKKNEEREVHEERQPCC